MIVNRRMLGVTAAALMIVAQAPDAMTAMTPAQLARRCRSATARSVRGLSHKGLKLIDRCAKRSSSVECAVIDDAQGTPYWRAQNRAAARIGVLCPLDNPASANFQGGAPADVIGPDVTQLLEASAELVLDGASGGARCARTIVKQGTKVILSTLDRATACQKRIDRESETFGGLSSSCLVDGGRASRRADEAIARRCTPASGTTAAACAPFPGCAINSAVLSGQQLAQVAYEAAASVEEETCGDGVVDVDAGEQCDDGNTEPTDACTDECQLALCFDGIVQAGVEACDDGNRIDDDCCSNACEAAVCGDGIVSAGCQEECDDAVDSSCSGCRFVPIVCDGSGLVATVAVRWDLAPNVTSGEDGGLGGVRLTVGYPVALTIATIPGTSPPFIDPSRLTNLVTESQASLVGRNLDVNGDGGPDLDILYGVVGNSFPAGEILTARFDCAAGTSVLTRNFTCAVTEASNPFGFDVVPASAIPCSVVQASLPSSGGS